MPFRMKSGELRNTVTIEKPVATVDAYNTPVPEWKSIASCVRCRITGKSGAEQTIGDKQVSIVTYEVVMRYRTTVLPNMRLVYGEKYLNIDAVFDPDGMRRWVVCVCKETTQ